MIVAGENEIPSMIESDTASDSTTPIAVPSTMPTKAPKVDTMIASQRTILRVCRLVMPTARIRPDLPRPLEHGEAERDRDAENGDDDRERQQHRDDHEQLVDLRGLRVLELVGASPPSPAGSRRAAFSIAVLASASLTPSAVLTATKKSCCSPPTTSSTTWLPISQPPTR